MVCSYYPPERWDEELHRSRGAVVLPTASLRAVAACRLCESAQVWADDLSEVTPGLTPFVARILIGGAVGASIAAAWHGDDSDIEIPPGTRPESAQLSLR